jgi:hypothetical protein
MKKSLSLEEKLNIILDIVLAKKISPYLEKYYINNPERDKYEFNVGYFHGVVDTYMFLTNNEYGGFFPWDIENENSRQFDLIENLK